LVLEHAELNARIRLSAIWEQFKKFGGEAFVRALVRSTVARMSRSRWTGWAALAALLSLASGCSCGAGTTELGAAGTTAGGPGIDGEDGSAANGGAGASGMNGLTDSAIDEPDSAVDELDGAPDSAQEPQDARYFKPTNGFFVVERGVAWELDSEGTFFALWDEATTDDPHAIVSGLTRLPWEAELGDAWYCIGEGSTFTPSQEQDDRGDSALRNLTRLPACETGDETADLGEGGLRFQLMSSIPELDMTNAEPLGARCADQMCEIYFATLDEAGGIGFLFMHMETATAVGMTPFNPAETPIEIESAYVALIRDDGSALIACASGGLMSREASSAAIFSLTGVGAPVSCPGGTAGPSALDFTTQARASSEQR
jgi:hypothetical protein